jgi:hypothetical protein
VSSDQWTVIKKGKATCFAASMKHLSYDLRFDIMKKMLPPQITIINSREHSHCHGV